MNSTDGDRLQKLGRTDRRAVDLDLQRRIPPSISIAQRAEWDRSSPPSQLPAAFDARLSAKEIRSLVRAAAPHLARVLKPLLIYCGVTPADDASKTWFEMSPTFTPETSFAHATLRLWGQRVALRGVPHGWGRENDRLRTPFFLKYDASQGRSEIYIIDGGRRLLLAQTKEHLEPEAACLDNFSYFSDGKRSDRDTSITINPIQTCPMRCGFCRRQYDVVDSINAGRGPGVTEPKKKLVRLDAAQAAEHLTMKHEIQWGSGVQVAIVTGAFHDAEHLCTWLEEFAAEMRELTHGDFDPQNNPHQNLHILTHLAHDRGVMLRLRAAGVKTVQDTIEIVDNDVRRAIMPSANVTSGRLVAKGEVPFEECVAAVPDGIDVFGSNSYFATLVLGLDSLATTLRGIEALRDAGLTYLDYPSYQVFEKRGIALYGMSASELVEANSAADQTFQPVYHGWRQDTQPFELGLLPE